MKNKKGAIFGIPLIIILILLGIGIYYATGGLLAISENIYCNDYEFTCCGERLDWTVTKEISQKTPYVCDGTKCIIHNIIVKDVAGNTDVYVGSQNCYVNDPWYASAFYTCSDEKRISFYPYELKKDEAVYGVDRRIGESELKISLSRYYDRLMFCGTAACSAGETGVEVPGSSQCTFVTDESIYDTSGTIKKEITTGSFQYTVPDGQCILSFPPGNRHICGNINEVCKDDSDCRGHTYNGNQECYGRTLQTYGCKKIGFKPGTEELNRMPWETQTWYSFESRCEIINSKTVECCGDADCGTGTCDKQTWTCKAPVDVKCRIDWDCGTSEICDRTKMELQKRTCKNPGLSTSYCENVKIQDVDCCLTADCASGYYCDSDHTCKQDVTPKKDCPYQCCIEEANYFERPCPGSKVCCSDHSCADSVELCSGGCVKESVAMGNCNNNLDDDCDNLIDDQDPDCKICKIDGVIYDLNPQSCCEEKNGVWIEKETKAPWYMFWKGTTTTSYCRISHVPIWAIIILVLGFITLLPIPYISMVPKPVGIITMIIGGIWLILGLMGVA